MSDQDNIVEEKTITLRKPVEFAGETYTEMKLREPTAGEWEIFDKLSGVAADIVAISVVAGIPKQAVGKIGSRDLVAGSKFLAHFLA